MKGNVDEFCSYLKDQVGQPYVWGGQHTKLTPQNYVKVITDKESDASYRKQAIDFCKARFDAGATVLFGYDCSGLGMYWLENLKKIYTTDMSSNTMYSHCTKTDTPKKGYWVFRLSGSKATHIGYMITDTQVVHAKGRKYGVVSEKYSKTYWHAVGIPKCMDFSPEPDPPQPDPPEPTPTKEYVRVKRKCRVRAGNGTSYKTLAIAYKGNEYPCYGQDDKDPYWFKVKYNGKDGWITCNNRYTELVKKVK